MNRPVTTVLCAVLLLGLVSEPSRAQGTSGQSGTIRESGDTLVRFGTHPANQVRAGNPTGCICAASDPELADPIATASVKREIFVAYGKSYVDFYDYKAKLREANVRLYQWQQHASEVTLWVVITVVLSGVLFSGFQLWTATGPRVVNIPPAKPEPAAGMAAEGASSGEATKPHLAEGVELTSNLEISASSVRITSSVVGVVVLVISLAFFYLFLQEVYTIQPSGSGAVQSQDIAKP
jgi:hypothetical protein